MDLLKKTILLGLVLVLVITVSKPNLYEEQHPYLVILKEKPKVGLVPLSQKSFVSDLTSKGIQVGNKLTIINAVEVYLTPTEAEMLKSDPRVALVHKERKLKLLGIKTLSLKPLLDTSVGNISAKEVWDYTNGSGVTVGVVDTGSNDVSVFSNQITAEEDFTFDDPSFAVVFTNGEQINVSYVINLTSDVNDMVIKLYDMNNSLFYPDWYLIKKVRVTFYNDSIYNSTYLVKGEFPYSLEVGNLEQGLYTLKINETDCDYYMCYLFAKFYSGTSELDNSSVHVNSTRDDMLHGTHVASIISSSHYKYKGVAPGANLVIAKALADTNGNAAIDSGDDTWESNVYKAIEWEIGKGARIISLSIGDDSVLNCNGTSIFSQVIDNATRDNNILFTLASGNSGSNGVVDPACSKLGLAVGNVNDNGVLAQDSSYGTTSDGRAKPEVVAPGTDIWAPVIDYNSTHVLFEALDGTSMAAPHVAGVAALLLSAKPTLTADELKALIMVTADCLGTTGTGLGKVNASRAYNMINQTFETVITNGARHIYIIKPVENEIRVLLYWPDPMYPKHNVLDMLVYAPNGTLMYNNTANTNETYEYFRITNAQDGNWTVIVNGTNITYNSPQKYVLSAVGDILKKAITSDTQVPNVTLSSLRTVYDVNETVVFNIKAYDNTSVKNVSVVINGTSYDADFVGVVDDNGRKVYSYRYEFDNTSFTSKKSLNYAILASDYFGNINSSTVGSFIVMDIAPRVYLKGGSFGSLNGTSFKFPFEVYDGSDSLNCSIFLNDTLNITETFQQGVQSFFEITGLSNKTYVWKINCTDESGNTTLSSTNTTTLFHKPVLIINSTYVNDTVVIPNETFRINVTIENGGEANLTASLKGIQFTIGDTNVDKEYSVSSNTVSLKHGEQGNLTIDIVAGDSLSTGDVAVNITLSFVDDWGTYSSTNNTSTTFKSDGILPTVKKLLVGGKSITSHKWISVKSQEGENLFKYLDPYVSTNYVEINVTFGDNSTNVKMCWNDTDLQTYDRDPTCNKEIASLPTNYTHSWNMTNLKDGYYWFMFQAEDLNGSKVNSSWYALEVDTVSEPYPYKDLVIGNTYNNTNGTFKVYVVNSGGVEANFSYKVKVNSTLLKEGNFISISPKSYVSIPFDFKVYAENDYEISFTIYNNTKEEDTTNDSLAWGITINKTPPIISVVSGPDSFYSGNSGYNSLSVKLKAKDYDNTSNLNLKARFVRDSGSTVYTYCISTSSYEPCFEGSFSSLGNDEYEFSETIKSTTKDGTYYIFFVVEDQDGNKNITNVTFRVDNTNPTVDVNGPSSLAKGETGTFSCSASDGGSDVKSVKLVVGGTTVCDENSDSCSGSYTMPDESPKPVTCAAYDNVGNKGSDEYTLKVSSSSQDSQGGDSGGGSGDQETSTYDAEKVFSSISPNSPAVWDVDLSGVFVDKINVYVDQTVSNLKLAVKKRTSFSGTKPSGVVYGYLDIFAIGDVTNLKEAKIYFKVSKSWIEDYNINQSTIVLQRYKTSWEPLNTTEYNSDSNYVYFYAITPGFSTFAVTGEKLSEATGEGSTDQTQETTSNKTYIEGEEGEGSWLNSSILYILLAAVGVAIGIVIYFLRENM